MARRPQGAFTEEEKHIVKGLLLEAERNQDIRALVNTGRSATINIGRITEVKQDDTINPSSAEELDFYRVRKNSYDPQTGLNLYDDERLIRAREAMLLAVQVFNSPTLKFKADDLRPDFPPAFGRNRRLISGLMRPWFPVSISLQIPAA